ncbi:hypothetical protein ACVDFE_15890 [Lentzea chajnantorensis]
MTAIAVIAAVVSLCSVAVALWQAREAKNAQEAARKAQEEAAAARKAVEQATSSALQAKTAVEESRKAAEDARRGVDEARGAAVSAQDAAGAARMLADEAQRAGQFAIERVEEVAESVSAERRRRGMPSFEITPGAPDEFHLSYVGGPPVLDQVTVSVVPGSRVLGLSVGDEPPGEQVEIGPLPNGASVAFRAATGQRASPVFSVSAQPWEPVVVRADQ